MELTDRIILTRHHYAPVGTPIDRYSISDQPVEVLVANLARQGIQIDPNCSEKSIKYFQRIDNESSCDKVVTVSLATPFPKKVESEPVAFYLRDGRGLELTLENYDNITIRPSGGMIGGPFAGDFGIQCKLRVQQEVLDKTIAKKVERALKDTYQTELASLDDEIELFTVVKPK